MNSNNPFSTFRLVSDTFAQKYPTFQQKVHNDLLFSFFVFTYYGEYDAIIMYPIILNKLKKGMFDEYFIGISENEKNAIISDFSSMIEEEHGHFKFIHDVLETYYKNYFPQITSESALKEKKEITLQDRSQMSLPTLLLKYYIGECYLWVCFYKFYNSMEDSEEREMMRTLLIEESRHNKTILKFTKKIKNNIDANVELYNDSIYFLRFFRHFEIVQMDNIFKFVIEICKKNHGNIIEQIINDVYDSDWHKEFKSLMIRKVYKIINLLYPHISIEEFEKEIYG